MKKRRQESEIEKGQREPKQRKKSALDALGKYLQYRNNLDILLKLNSTYVEDIIWQLTPEGALPKTGKRLRSAGVNEIEFTDKVNAVLNLAHDRIIQPPTRRVIITGLWNAFQKARKN